METLLGWWADARQRAFLGEYGPASVALDPADYLTEIALGTRIAAEVTSGRWVAVARLLQLGAVSHWDEIGTALGVTGEEAVAGFTSWITSQAALYRRTGIGLTDADAHAHVRLADAVPGDHIPRHNCPCPRDRRAVCPLGRCAQSSYCPPSRTQFSRGRGFVLH